MTDFSLLLADFGWSSFLELLCCLIDGIEDNYYYNYPFLIQNNFNDKKKSTNYAEKGSIYLKS